MAREARVNIINKSASLQTVTYTNWTDSTSRSVVIPAGGALTTYNWHENDGTADAATTENIFNLPINDTNPLVLCLLLDFAYDKDRVSVKLTYDYQA